MYEVRYRRQSHDAPPQQIRSVFIFFAFYNFTRWGVAIVTTACRSDFDNSVVLGEQVWELTRPLLRSSLVFLYILSGFLYWTLTTEHHETEKISRTPSKTLAQRLGGISELVSKVATTAEHRVKARHRVCEQTVQCVRYGDSVKFSYKVVTLGQLRLSDLMYVCAFPAIIIVMVPPVLYGVMLHLHDIDEDGEDLDLSDLKCNVDLTLNCLIMCLSGVILAIVPDWPTKTNPSEVLESFGRTKRAALPLSGRILSWFLNKR